MTVNVTIGDRLGPVSLGDYLVKWASAWFLHKRTLKTQESLGSNK